MGIGARVERVTVRVGFLGGGFIARYHHLMLGVSGADVELVGVHDPDPAKAAGFAESTGAPVVDDEGALIERADAVYVCTWTSEHPRLVAAVAAAGRAVFCEKPLAVDLDGATRLCAAVAAAGVVNQVGLVLRDSPALRWLRRRVTEDGDGAPITVLFRDDQYLPTQGQYGSVWRGDRARAGSGTLLEHSIHDLDVLEWVMGPVDRVSATTAAHHGLDGIEDLAVVTLHFASGATGTLTSIWHDHLGRESSRRIEVFRDRALYTVDGDLWGPVHWSRSPGDHGGESDIGTLEGQPLITSLEEDGVDLRNPDGAFIDAVAAGTPAHPDVTVALRAHVLTDAVYRSAGLGSTPVPVPPGVPSGVPAGAASGQPSGATP